MGRITISLQEDEQEALWQLAKREVRDPRQQIRMVLRRELQDRGLLEATEEERREREIEIREMAEEIAEEVGWEWGVRVNVEEVGDPVSMTAREWTRKCEDIGIQKRLGGPPDVGQGPVTEEMVDAVYDRLRPKGTIQ